jgi:predicted RNase H-like nuclease (RuvC/YqgF family)
MEKTPRRRRYSEEELITASNRASAATAGKVQDLEASLMELRDSQHRHDIELHELRIALLGMPGARKGALEQQDERISSLEKMINDNSARIIALSSELPEIIAAAISAASDRLSAHRLAGIGRAGWAVIGMVLASALTTIVVNLLQHVGKP